MVHFVDIGGFDTHHCVNFFFIIIEFKESHIHGGCLIRRRDFLSFAIT